MQSHHFVMFALAIVLGIALQRWFDVAGWIGLGGEG